jgi:hypothetical protein
MSTQEQTCGIGLAENSALPGKLAEVTGRMADVLELHIPTLDLSDPHSREERDAYQQLVDEYRQISARLRRTATQMAGYRDLPMGRHDLEAAADPRTAEAYGAFVRAKQELLALLAATTDGSE